MYPREHKYTKQHEWVRLEDDRVVVGITDYAQDQLGDVVFLSVPEAGSQVSQFNKFGEIESVKAVSDLFSPVSGEVVEVNQEAVAEPEVVNQDPHGKGWLIKVSLSRPGELDALMSSAQYEDYLRTLPGPA